MNLTRTRKHEPVNAAANHASKVPTVARSCSFAAMRDYPTRMIGVPRFGACIRRCDLQKRRAEGTWQNEARIHKLSRVRMLGFVETLGYGWDSMAT
jgi:hypothetical protein